MSNIETTGAVPAKNIQEAINRVMQKVTFVAKERGGGLKYSFASEAGLISALRPPMVEEGIIMFATGYDSVETREYKTDKGTSMVNVALTGHFRFVHVHSLSFIDVSARSEGSDAGDKANNKAMTGAYKYALRQTFIIETGDDPDKDQDNDRAESGRSVNVLKGWPEDKLKLAVDGLWAENLYDAAAIVAHSKLLKASHPDKAIQFWFARYRGYRDMETNNTVDESAEKADRDLLEVITAAEREKPNNSIDPATLREASGKSILEAAKEIGGEEK